MPEKLVNVFTRDFSLGISQWWASAQQDNFNRLLGVGYTDTPAAHNGLSAAYFYLQNDWNAIGRTVVQRLKDEPDFYVRVREPYVRNVEAARSFLKQVETQDSLTPETLARLRQYLSGLYPVIRFTYAIPSHWADSLRHALGAPAESIISSTLSDRAKTEGVFEAIDGQLRRLAEASLARLGKSRKLAKFLTADELNALARGEPLGWADVSARTAGFTYCKGQLYLTKDYQSVFRENGYAFDEPKAEGNEAVGSVAHDGGIKTGVVRCIFALEQLASFQDGEVLVCPMTVPDFVPAMKKAVAVVTDEGGLACHAAIVCRELKIPCVVGTKMSTKMFQDGDRVEVDTTRGRVLKLR